MTARQMKPATTYLYRYTLRRADGREEFVSSHQPDPVTRKKTKAELRKVAASILAMPHWQKFLGDQAGTVVAVVKTTTEHLGPGVTDAAAMHNAPEERIAIA